MIFFVSGVAAVSPDALRFPSCEVSRTGILEGMVNDLRVKALPPSKTFQLALVKRDEYLVVQSFPGGAIRCTGTKRGKSDQRSRLSYSRDRRKGVIQDETVGERESKDNRNGKTTRGREKAMESERKENSDVTEGQLLRDDSARGTC